MKIKIDTLTLIKNKINKICIQPITTGTYNYFKGIKYVFSLNPNKSRTVTTISRFANLVSKTSPLILKVLNCIPIQKGYFMIFYYF